MVAGQMRTSAIRDEIDPDRIIYFDLYGLNDDDRLKPYPQLGLAYLQEQAPDIFYTPANGGHWVVTRDELMREILMSPERFSSAETVVPRSPDPPTLIPLTLDPPAHTPYRRILMRYFAPKVIQTMEDNIRAWADKFVRRIAARGHCEFIKAVGAPLPVFVFMEMMGLPFEKFDEFRELVVEYFGLPGGARQNEIGQIIIGRLAVQIEARRREPRDDLVSRLLAEEIDGRRLSPDELISICFLLFLAGLDTVANVSGFIFHRLASAPDLQAKLVANPNQIPAFLEEAFRMSGVVNTSRLVAHDMPFAGVTLRAGDMVVCPLALAGFDERANPDSHTFDISRGSATHLMFATGPHLCVGHLLARLELRVLLEEWLKAIPQFSLAPDYVRRVQIGPIIGLINLDLVWPVIS